MVLNYCAHVHVPCFRPGLTFKEAVLIATPCRGLLLVSHAGRCTSFGCDDRDANCRPPGQAAVPAVGRSSYVTVVVFCDTHRYRKRQQLPHNAISAARGFRIPPTARRGPVLCPAHAARARALRPRTLLTPRTPSHCLPCSRSCPTVTHTAHARALRSRTPLAHKPCVGESWTAHAKPRVFYDAIEHTGVRVRCGE